jgi:endonuclease/exonuclease/phosphatase family metal-dependent hydrolase
MAGFLLLISYISPFIDPSRFWIFSFFGLAYPYLLVLNFMFILLWILHYNKYFLLSTFVILLGYHYVSETIKLSKPKNTESGIKIVSYNLNQGYYMYDKGIEKGSLADYLIDLEPDILLLQEMNTDYIKEELRILKSFPYKVLIPEIGTGIYSKYPYIKKGKVDFTLETNSCIWADFKLKKDTIRIYCVHFQSNQVSKEAETMVQNIEKEKGFKSQNLKKILNNYKKNVQVRADQVKLVKNHILRSKYPVIIGGDFNDPPVSYTYHEFNAFLKDSFKEKGFGLGITYQGAIPLLRIDYIMVSNEIQVTRFNTLKRKLSDHYPIEAEIKIQ